MEWKKRRRRVREAFIAGENSCVRGMCDESEGRSAVGGRLMANCGRGGGFSIVFMVQWDVC